MTTLTAIVKYLQLCSANPPGIAVIPNLERAKCTEIKAAPNEIKGWLANIWKNENHGKLKPTDKTEMLLKPRATCCARLPPLSSPAPLIKRKPGW